MTVITIDLDEASTEELMAAADLVTGELDRRGRIEQAEAQIDEIVRGVLDALGRQPGDPYEEPTGYHNAYPKGWTVTHGGKTWEASRDGASGEPGVVLGDWREVVEPGEIPDWRQPQAGQEYPVGAVVRHEGRLWRNDHVGPNGWRPGTPHSQWADIGPAE